MAPVLRLFVYGTLKRGWWNHPRYCAGYMECRQADVLGRLYQLPSGIPMLRVPDERVLGEGSASASRDMALQARMDRVLALHPETGGPLTLEDAWAPIRGELFAFAEAHERLRALDRLEGYMPGGPSAYKRVLVAVRPHDAERPVAAWTYVWPGSEDGDDVLERLAAYLPGGRWPVGESTADLG